MRTAALPCQLTAQGSVWCSSEISVPDLCHLGITTVSFTFGFSQQIKFASMMLQ